MTKAFDGEVLTPSSEITAETPVSVAMNIARNAVGSAADIMNAAHHAVIGNLDRAFSEDLLTGPEFKEISSSELSDARAQINRSNRAFLGRSESRSLMLTDALQRMAISDIASASSAVTAIQRATAEAYSQRKREPS